MGRLQTLPAHTVVKRIYTELLRPHSCGLHTWVTKVLELSKRYGINFNEINSRNFELECKRVVKTHFENQWVADTQNVPKTQYSDLTRFMNMAYILSRISIQFLTVVTRLL